MNSWQNTIENKLYSFGKLIASKPLYFLLLSIVVVIPIVLNLSKIKIDTTIESFLHKDDKALIDYNNFKHQFGKDDKIVVSIESKDVFSEKTLSKLQKLHKELESNTPFLDQIDSLVNVRDTKGINDELIVDDFLAKFPQTTEEREALRNRAKENILYQDLILSKDNTITNIVLTLQTYQTKELLEGDLLNGFEDQNKEETPKEFITQEQITKAIFSISNIVKKYESEDFKTHIVGSSVVDAYIKSIMQEDVKKFMRIIIVIIAIILFILFRRVYAVIIPLITVILSVLVTIGFMAFLDVPLKMTTQILPSFLLAIGVGATIHFLSIFTKELNKTGDKKEAIAYTFNHSGLPIILTSITTSVGLFSFYFSENLPISDLGMFASIGVMAALFFTLIFLPALLSILPIKPKDTSNNKIENTIDTILKTIAAFSVRNATKIVVVSLIIVLTSLLLSSQLKFSHNNLKWLPSDYETRISTEFLDKKMNGTVTAEAIVDTGKTNGVQEYEVLKKIESFQNYALSLQSDKYFVGKAWSVVEVLKETNKALHNNDKNHYTIPKDQALISQELFLFENSGSDDLEELVDSQFSKARITIKVPWIDAVHYDELLNKLQSNLTNSFKDSATITVTGIAPIFSKTINAAINSSATSYMIAFGVITLMMIFLVSNVKLGLISMIPNLSPIIFILSIMYIFNMPLDMFTMLIGSIAIGIVVDDTIHFMHNFKRYYLESGDIAQSVEKTLSSTGRAIFVTTIVLSLGFLVYTFATLGHLANFGVLSSITICMALVADFFLAPALMTLLAKKILGDKK